MTDRSFQAKNQEERQLLNALVQPLSAADLEKQVSHGWTIKATLVHLAFYDLRALTLLEKFEKEGISPSPNHVEVINEVVRIMSDLIPGGAAVQMWLLAAEKLDRKIESVADSLIDTIRATDPLPLNLPRHMHRTEHRQEIELAVRS